MRGLMKLCRNSEKRGCNPIIFKYQNVLRSLRKTARYNIQSQWPSEEEIMELDAICRECEFRFFWIERKECPVCESQNFKEAKAFEFFDGEAKIRQDYFLICKNCGTFSRYINLL